TGCHIYGVSAWGLKLKGIKQQNLVVTHAYEPEITVDNIEVAITGIADRFPTALLCCPPAPVVSKFWLQIPKKLTRLRAPRSLILEHGLSGDRSAANTRLGLERERRRRSLPRLHRGRGRECNASQSSV